MIQHVAYRVNQVLLADEHEPFHDPCSTFDIKQVTEEGDKS
jgi:hypothetical protein